MKRVLVTGGCGYVGSQLIRTLAESEPDEVRILDNLQRESHRALMDLPAGVRYRFFGGDLLDRKRNSSIQRSSAAPILRFAWLPPSPLRPFLRYFSKAQIDPRCHASRFSTAHQANKAEQF